MKSMDSTVKKPWGSKVSVSKDECSVEYMYNSGKDTITLQVIIIPHTQLSLVHSQPHFSTLFPTVDKIILYETLPSINLPAELLNTIIVNSNLQEEEISKLLVPGVVCAFHS